MFDETYPCLLDLLPPVIQSVDAERHPKALNPHHEG